MGNSRYIDDVIKKIGEEISSKPVDDLINEIFNSPEGEVYFLLSEMGFLYEFPAVPHYEIIQGADIDYKENDCALAA